MGSLITLWVQSNTLYTLQGFFEHSVHGSESDIASVFTTFCVFTVSVHGITVNSECFVWGSHIVTGGCICGFTIEFDKKLKISIPFLNFCAKNRRRGDKFRLFLTLPN